MNINELSDKQKSVTLARLCGWHINAQDDEKIWITCPDEAYSTTNLYQPVFMFLAWRVLNWASENGLGPQMDVISKYQSDWTTITQLPPERAQRAWLDEILKSAIEVGLIDLRAEEREP